MCSGDGRGAERGLDPSAPGSVGPDRALNIASMRRPNRIRREVSGRRSSVACLSVLHATLGFGAVSAASAQAPDSIRSDSIYDVRGVTVNVTRPVTTSGGSAAVEVRIDSLNVVPLPTMEEVLRAMPLVQVRENSRGEAQPSLRGSDDRQIAVLMDGIPLTLGWDHRSDLSIIPLSAVEDIRLIRGLSSVLYGPNVLGGVVEVDVARGSHAGIRPPPLALQGGVDNTGATQLGGTGGALLERSSGRWVLRGGAGYRQRDGQPLSQRLILDSGDHEELLSSDGDLRLNSDLEHFDGFLSARYQSDDDAWFSIGGSGYTAERGVPPEVNEDSPRLWRYPNQWRVVTAATGGTGPRQTSWGEGDLEASVGLDLQHTTIDEFGTPTYDDVTGGETGDTRTLSLRLLGEHTATEDGQLRASFTYGDVSHDEALLPDDSEARYRQRLWSLGAEADWSLGSTGTARLSAGAVVDGADTPESGDKQPLGTLWDWGGRVGITSVVGDGGARLHASLSRRTRFPSLRELYSGALGRFIPNPELLPESLVGAEMGVTMRRGPAEIQAVGFHHRIEDGIVRVTVQTDDGAKRIRVNQNQIRATGLELLATGSFGWLDYTADLTLQRVRLQDEDGEAAQAEYQPDAFGKLSLGGGLPAEVYWHATGRFLGSQFCTAATAEGADTLDPSGALDLGLRRVFHLGRPGVLTSLDLLASVDNVTDSGYYDQCGLPRPGRRFRIQFRLF